MGEVAGGYHQRLSKKYVKGKELKELVAFRYVAEFQSLPPLSYKEYFGIV